MTKHTPGPWSMDKSTQEETRLKIVGPEGWLGVAQAFGDCEEETKSNAALIAAAPDLLAACKDARDAIATLSPDALGYARDGIEGWPIKVELLSKIDAAIARAEGRNR